MSVVRASRSTRPYRNRSTQAADCQPPSCATNFTEQTARVTVRYSLQRDPALYSQPLPDPVFGSDHAAGSRSWLVVDGETIQDTSSTDGKPWTATTTPWQREHYTEAFQFVDLGQVREIRKLTWLSGDANHSWFVDVSASEDGENFVPVPGLSNVDHHKKWGWREFPVERPFKARVLKFRYKTAGGREDLIAFPCELGVYDGADDEAVALPNVGPSIEDGLISVDVPARSFAVQALEFSKPLEPGAYLLGLSVEREGSRELSYRHVFCSLPGATGTDHRRIANRLECGAWQTSRRSYVSWASVSCVSRTASGRSSRASRISTRSRATSLPGT